tara:strand:+ start:160 stop:777 length:618 start_codon:yes stop_codon:yes gene_type:complete
MDSQQMIVCGMLLIVGLYIMKDVSGVTMEGMGSNMPMDYGNYQGVGSNVFASEPGDQGGPLKVNNLQTDKTSCYPQNTLTPADLLPSGQSKQIQDFNNQYPVGEGILKGVNFLDAGFHVGVNTIGQSLRNANRNLRAEPPNPQVKVSPWMNSTIAPDLARKSLNGETVCNQNSSSDIGGMGDMGDMGSGQPDDGARGPFNYSLSR